MLRCQGCPIRIEAKQSNSWFTDLTLVSFFPYTCGAFWLHSEYHIIDNLISDRRWRSKERRYEFVFEDVDALIVQVAARVVWADGLLPANVTLHWTSFLQYWTPNLWFPGWLKGMKIACLRGSVKIVYFLVALHLSHRVRAEKNNNKSLTL